MHGSGRNKMRFAGTQLPVAVKGLALIFVLCVIVRVLSAVGADTASEDYITGLVSNGQIAKGILNFELGEQVGEASLASLILGSTIPSAVEAPDEEASEPSPDITGDTAPGNTDKANTGGTEAKEPGTSSQPQAAASPNVIVKPAAGTLPDAIAVNNKTTMAVDTAALLKEPLKLALKKGSPAVLIIHTHSSEAYMPAANDRYVPSDSYRTQDQNYSVIRVGDELEAAFKKNGISVIHDKGVYDYPSYEGAYNRSYTAIQSYLKKYPSIKIVIDLHRDAIEAKDGSVYKTIAQIGTTTCSQVMMVIGTNGSGLDHPNWHENFKLAVHMQHEMNVLYPSLAKPIELSQYRYNQQATPGSMIVEVGCTGNTLQESLAAVRFFADAASKVLLGLYK